MDAYSSGEDLLVKTRKPYTITKQRERWTEEEHNKFLEALKLYGRAWQRIEEHIGTKTAVQIRSHAQKFFSKLEKEASMKGIPLGQAIDIEIPPPRPKRKPSNPYPRKTGSVGVTTLQPAAVKEGKCVTSAPAHVGKQVFDLEKVPLLEKQIGNGGTVYAEEQNRDDGRSSEPPTSSHEAPSAFEASPGKGCTTKSAAINSAYNFRNFVPLPKHVVDKGECNGSHVSNGSNRNQKSDESDAAETNETEEMQSCKNFPRHVPVHILSGSLGACSQGFSSDVSYQESAFPRMGVHGHPAFFATPGVSAPVESQSSTSRSTNHQQFPSNHPPFAPFLSGQEDYRSFLQMSSTFSNLVVSTLLQNPPAHAAANFAASFWPSTNVEAQTESPTGNVGGLAPRPTNSAPSVAAIAAATVAAATAWWAAHGLLPLCSPLHAGFTCPPAPATVPMRNQAAVGSKGRKENNFQAQASRDEKQPNKELSEASPTQPKSTTSSMSGSGEVHVAKPNEGIAADNHEQNDPAGTEQNDPAKSKNKRQVDRSSCGSNSASSSEVETDALHKKEEEKDEPKEVDENHSSADANFRRYRNLSCMNDPWKEVSEEGRVAFQALFQREVLPQSFSPPLGGEIEMHQKNGAIGDGQNMEQSKDDVSQIDLNLNTWQSSFGHQGAEKSGFGDEDNGKGLLTIGLGQGEPKVRRTGFKPYKRCSVEAKVTTATGEQEEGSKRLRLEGKVST